MRFLVASALVIAAAAALGATSAQAGRYYRQPRGGDCTPTNGPYGFYGNLWCQPSERSYLRNLSAQWPMETPPALRYPRRPLPTQD